MLATALYEGSVYGSVPIVEVVISVAALCFFVVQALCFFVVQYSEYVCAMANMLPFFFLFVASGYRVTPPFTGGVEWISLPLHRCELRWVDCDRSLAKFLRTSTGVRKI